jgi:hypothetical protein
MHRNAVILALCILQSPVLLAQAPIPDWCRALPRPEYKTLERVSISDPWFEVYKPAQGVFAIYEPHQAEETISYLIVGEQRALLFDTGMGISDLKKVISQLTKLPIILLNSHTHNDHVGDNWEFSRIYGMDTDFARQNARGSQLDAQAEITPDQICGVLPKGFDLKVYATRPWKITAYTRDAGKPVVMCAACLVSWSVDGKYLALQFGLPPNSLSQTYLLPVSGKRGLPELPPEGLSGPENLKTSNGGMVPPRVDSLLGPEKYSYTIMNIRRNIYRIPIS